MEAFRDNLERFGDSFLDALEETIEDHGVPPFIVRLDAEIDWGDDPPYLEKAWLVGDYDVDGYSIDDDDCPLEHAPETGDGCLEGSETGRSGVGWPCEGYGCDRGSTFVPAEILMHHPEGMVVGHDHLPAGGWGQRHGDEIRVGRVIAAVGAIIGEAIAKSPAGRIFLPSFRVVF